MDRRKVLFIFLIIVAIVLVILAIYFLFFNKKQVELPKEEAEIVIDQKINNGNSLVASEETEESEVVVPIDRELVAEDILKMAGAFAERFGSYSNHSDFKNFLDLEIFMTDKMKSWTQKIISESGSSYNDAYYGITTKAVSKEIQEFDQGAGRAVVLVKTQRKESADTVDNSSVYYQDIIITYIKERGVWKVDSAYWK